MPKKTPALLHERFVSISFFSFSLHTAYGCVCYNYRISCSEYKSCKLQTVFSFPFGFFPFFCSVFLSFFVFNLSFVLLFFSFHSDFLFSFVFVVFFSLYTI